MNEHMNEHIVRQHSCRNEVSRHVPTPSREVLRTRATPLIPTMNENLFDAKMKTVFGRVNEFLKSSNYQNVHEASEMCLNEALNCFIPGYKETIVDYINYHRILSLACEIWEYYRPEAKNTPDPEEKDFINNILTPTFDKSCKSDVTVYDTYLVCVEMIYVHLLKLV